MSEAKRVARVEVRQAKRLLELAVPAALSDEPVTALTDRGGAVEQAAECTRSG